MERDEYMKEIQQIKEEVLYMTEKLKGDRNILNKHFQNSITNYFLEDYASKFLKEKMKVATFREVRLLIDKKIDAKRKDGVKETKYMKLINAYYDEHIKYKTLPFYQQTLQELAFTKEENTYQIGSKEWISHSWKKATALFVLHHSLNIHLSSIFEIWNSLFPENPIIKKKKSKIERIREDIQTANKSRKSMYNYEEEEYDYIENKVGLATDQNEAIHSFNLKKIHRNPEDFTNLSDHDIDNEDSVSIFKEKIKNDPDNFESFPNFQYIPINDSEAQYSHSNYIPRYISNQDTIISRSQDINAPKSLVDITTSKSQDIKLSKDIKQEWKEKEDMVLNSLELIKQNEQDQLRIKKSQQLISKNNLFAFDDEDFFTRNMNIFQNIGINNFSLPIQKQNSQNKQNVINSQIFQPHQQNILKNPVPCLLNNFQNQRDVVTHSCNLYDSPQQNQNKFIGIQFSPNLIPNLEDSIGVFNQYNLQEFAGQQALNIQEDSHKFIFPSNRLLNTQDIAAQSVQKNNNEQNLSVSTDVDKINDFSEISTINDFKRHHYLQKINDHSIDQNKCNQQKIEDLSAQIIFDSSLLQAPQEDLDSNQFAYNHHKHNINLKSSSALKLNNTHDFSRSFSFNNDYIPQSIQNNQQDVKEQILPSTQQVSHNENEVFELKGNQGNAPLFNSLIQSNIIPNTNIKVNSPPDLHEGQNGYPLSLLEGMNLSNANIFGQYGFTSSIQGLNSIIYLPDSLNGSYNNQNFVQMSIANQMRFGYKSRQEEDVNNSLFLNCSDYSVTDPICVSQLFPKKSSIGDKSPSPHKFDFSSTTPEQIHQANSIFNNSFNDVSNPIREQSHININQPNTYFSPLITSLSKTPAINTQKDQ